MNPNQTLLNQQDVILPGKPFRKENLCNKLAKCCSYTNREFVGTAYFAFEQNNMLQNHVENFSTIIIHMGVNHCSRSFRHT